MYEDVIGRGEMVFTPSKCAHAVENLQGDLSIALTSNYVDLTNVMDVSDRLRAIFIDVPGILLNRPTYLWTDELLGFADRQGVRFVEWRAPEWQPSPTVSSLC